MKTIKYFVVITTGILNRMSREFPDAKSAKEEVLRLTEEDGFEKHKVRAVKRTLIEEDI